MRLWEGGLIRLAYSAFYQILQICHEAPVLLFLRMRFGFRSAQHGLLSQGLHERARTRPATSMLVPETQRATGAMEGVVRVALNAYLKSFSSLPCRKLFCAAGRTLPAVDVTIQIKGIVGCDARAGAN